jgi:UDP-N-acetylmuramate--alanine ligase
VATGSRAASGHAAGGELRLGVPGRHNLLNALAAVGVGLELGLAFEVIAGALAEFRGAERRFQVLGEAQGVVVVDDYGHHPTEITAVVATARAQADRRLVLVFQPHRYSRTRELLEEFGAALAPADLVVLTDIYAAGEDPLPNVTVEEVARAVERAGGAAPTIVKAVADVPEAVARLTRRGDLVITLGAGSIGTAGPRLLERLRAREGAGA